MTPEERLVKKRQDLLSSYKKRDRDAISKAQDAIRGWARAENEGHPFNRLLNKSYEARPTCLWCHSQGSIILAALRRGHWGSDWDPAQARYEANLNEVLAPILRERERNLRKEARKAALTAARSEVRDDKPTRDPPDPQTQLNN